jgi:hypothetical protein
MIAQKATFVGGVVLAVAEDNGGFPLRSLEAINNYPMLLSVRPRLPDGLFSNQKSQFW